MLICDVDGVLTDGRLWVGEDGQWRRFFHVRDGVGMKQLMEEGYQLGIISGGKSSDVETRLKFIGVHHLYLDASDKTGPFQEILNKTGLKPSEVAYIGDEVFDIPILEKVGVAVTVPDAVKEVKKAAHYTTKIPGGFGAARELCDLICKNGAYAKKGRRNK